MKEIVNEADRYPYGKKNKAAKKSVKDWVITYEDGKKEPFRGSASESFKYANSKAEMFAVEVAGDGDPTVDDAKESEKEPKPAK